MTNTRLGASLARLPTSQPGSTDFCRCHVDLYKAASPGGWDCAIGARRWWVGDNADVTKEAGGGDLVPLCARALTRSTSLCRISSSGRTTSFCSCIRRGRTSASINQQRKVGGVVRG